MPTQTPSNKLLNVVLAEHRHAVLLALRLWLCYNTRWNIISESVNTLQLLNYLQTTSIVPDVLLLDWNLPGMVGTTLMHHLQSHYPTLMIIVLSGRPEDSATALQAGAHAFVCKNVYPEQLMEVIDAID